ncbi:MAG: hypothetical protein KatS3mg105_0904 [Gemmatales bacterium]|nr:MAG: hypothetical protein KatS3mg105_0904 [Gemmatales bacterium]
MLRSLMRAKRQLCLAAGAAFLALGMSTPVQAQIFRRHCPDATPYCPAPYSVYPCPTAPEPDVKKEDKKEPEPVPEPIDPTITPEQFAATGGGEGFFAAAPNVIGDSVLGSGPAGVRIGALKIAENQNVRPQDRIYFNYNYFNNVNNTGVDYHREMPGFERTFLGGDASFGMSLPIFQSTSGPDVFGVEGFGNLNTVVKYAFINDPDRVITGGMSMTFPTGRGIRIPGQSTVNPVFFQPFGGYLFSGSLGYIQGFTSLAVPTDSRDITILFNDIAFGVRAYQSANPNARVQAIIPTGEIHINTPLNNRGLDNTPFGLQDSFIFTGGMHIVGQLGTLTLGVATPFTGPQPFDVEAVVLYNLNLGPR